MIARGDAVVAGVSGGGDSMALLYVLDRLRRELDFILTVVHVNHGIRGAEAERDQHTVERACGELNVPCTIKRYDVPRIADEWRVGEEEAGRILRREAFFRVASSFQQEGRRVRIALAHNQNDLAETILHHLARGAGIRGLSGMAPVSGEIIRPFLSLERREIDQYLKEQGILYVLDSTNLSDDYTRNRIRHHILPAMEREVNGGTVAHLAETSLVLRQADHYLSAQAGKLLENCPEVNGGILLDEGFFSADPILISYGILEAFSRIVGRRKDVSSIHVRQVAELYEKQTGRKSSLPCGVEAVRDYGGVLLRKNPPGMGRKPGRAENPVAVENHGTVENPGVAEDFGTVENPAIAVNSDTAENPGIMENPGIAENSHTAENSGTAEHPGIAVNFAMAESGGASPQWALPTPGKLSCPLGNFMTDIFTYNGEKIPEKTCTKWLDYDKINGNLAVRTRKNGDYLIFNQKGNKKKLKNFFIDEKIPREERNRLALVTRGAEVLWIAGGRMSGGYKITPETKRVLEIRYESAGEAPAEKMESENMSGRIPGGLIINTEKTRRKEDERENQGID